MSGHVGADCGGGGAVDGLVAELQQLGGLGELGEGDEEDAGGNPVSGADVGAGVEVAAGEHAVEVVDPQHVEQHVVHGYAQASEAMRGPLVLVGSGGGMTGRLATQGSSEIIDVRGVRAVLVRDPSLGVGYRIQTAYPVPYP